MISPLARYIILLVTALHLIVLGWIIGLSTPLPWEQTRLLTLTLEVLLHTAGIANPAHLQNMEDI